MMNKVAGMVRIVPSHASGSYLWYAEILFKDGETKVLKACGIASITYKSIL